MTLTTRLSLFLLVGFAAVLVTFSVALYLLAHHHLHQQLNDRLVATAHTLASAAEIEPDGVEWEPHNRPLTLAPGAFGDQLRWAVADDAGNVIDRSPQPDVEEFVVQADESFRAGHRPPRPVDHGGRTWQVTRLRLEPEKLPPGPLKPGKFRALELTVAVPLDPVHDTLRVLVTALASLAVAVLVIVLFVGRAVCRRALSPVARMADAARSMGVTDLASRLPAPASRDELADLATAFNSLLDRLAEALERERRFAGEASHQLRTPLAAIIGQVEVALRRDREPTEYRRTLSAVLHQAGRLRRVVEALLFLARSEADARLPGVEQVNLAVWVSARLRTWEHHPRTRDLVFESPADNLPAMIHPDLFGELLDALLDNALKYSTPGTLVLVRVGRDLDGTWVEVEDRGCGIAPEDVPHLFRPFFRSETARVWGVPGLGLGLAVAARVAAALGGSITVDSKPGRGSRFRVRLSEAGDPIEQSVTAPTP